MDGLTAFELIWAVLLCAPPLAVALYILLRKLRPRVQLPITSAAIFVLLFIVAMKFLGFAFVSAIGGVTTFAIAYFTYCFVVAACLQIPFRIVRYLTMGLTALPICAGYLLATIGIFGLMSQVAASFGPPTYVEKMGPDLVCEVGNWGTAVSASGYYVHLYKLWPAIPFIEQRVSAFAVVQSGSVWDAPPEDKNCSDALAAYSR